MGNRLFIAVLAAAAWAAPALSDTFGPPFGANSYSTSIDTVNSVEDADDYVAFLVAGESLIVTATAGRGSALLPALSLVAPDGVVTALIPPAVVEKKQGKVVTLSKFAIAATGRWTVRVAGKNHTQGAYTVKFSVGAARPTKLTKQHLGGADPMFRDVTVDAVDGALLSVTVTWPKTQSLVHIGPVKDPSGAESTTGTPPVEKKGSSKLTKRTLHQGHGPYTFRLAVDSGETTYTVTTTVTPQSRPKSKKAVVLSAAEPFLDVRATPVRGDGALTAHLTGAGFVATPQVYFGGVPGTGVVVAAAGDAVDVVVPTGAPDSVVDVAVVQADGQASVRAGYFVYVPLPTITDLKRSSGQTSAGESTAGGTALTLVGTGFLTGHVVQFGSTDAVGVTVVDATHVSLATPPEAPGVVAVTVEDEFARTAAAPFQFEFKDPPTLTASPFSPAFAPTVGGAVVTITGTAFESTDQLQFNGANRNSTFVNATTRTFVTPAIAAGLCSVRLVDRLGLVAAGPDFEVKDPPGFASSPYSPAFASTAGGVTVTITGSGFESTDQLRFNGANLTSTFVNGTTRRFTSPAIAAGVYSIDLTDRFGVRVTGPTFEVKSPPAFAATPYSPAFAGTAGGVTITITGSGFESTDRLFFAGTIRTSTFVNATTRRFDTIPASPGVYSVQLIDRLGLVGTGPNFEIKDPPAFAPAPYSPAFSPTAGGTTVTITGTGFETTDQLRFNGVNVASTFVSATTRRFTTPAIAAGAYSVQLVDRLGATSSGPSFDVKDPPTFAASPYSPAFAGTAGGTTVTITGTGFESADQLRFNGANRSSTFVSSTTRTFVTPAAAKGSYSVQIVDRFGATVNGPSFEIKDPPAFAASPYSPAYGPVAGGATITITGTGFESTDQLRFNGSILTSTFVNSTTRRFTSPALTAGPYSVQLIDRLGLVGTGPNFHVQAAPTISSVQATAGPMIDATHVAVGGGATIQVTGVGFASDNTVAVGGAAGSITSVTSTQIQFTAPAGTIGAASLVVTDAVGQSATSSNALTYVGFDDQTASRQPGASSVDNFMAARGAVGDLDNDGVADDLVMTTQYGVGSRSVYTRILFGNGGALTDVTDSNFPGVNGYGDAFNANAVAVGDLDGNSAQDILIAGWPAYYGKYYQEARVFTNDGSGTFTESVYSPRMRTAAVTCTGAYGGSYPVFTPATGTYGSATALAIGDLDNDGAMDFVMATTHYRYGYVHIQPSYVTFTRGAYYDANAAGDYSSFGSYYYTSATRVFRGTGKGGFEDTTFPSMPLCGSYPSTYSSFPGRDVKLGDVDGDKSASLDIVVTWDDPTTVSPYGQFTYSQYGYSHDSARVSTQILINDGNGFFTDQTATWLPSASSPEFWQGNRVELVDLDADGRKDLVILHAQPLDGSTTTMSSLRVLQNTGSSFVDVTSSALPSVPLSGTADDNLRGTALIVRDVDGDGHVDIVVGTTEQLLDSSGNPARSTRLLRGDGSLHFTLANEFLPAPSVDTGEARDLLLGDVGGAGVPSLLLLSESAPSTSTNGELLRVFDWR